MPILLIEKYSTSEKGWQQGKREREQRRLQRAGMGRLHREEVGRKRHRQEGQIER